MKKNEVCAWIDYHASLFTDWKYYRADSPAGKQVAFIAFSKALAGIEVDDATEASDRMLAGTVKKPFRDEDHLASIVSSCKQIVSQRYAEYHKTIDGEKVIDCPICGDTGFIEYVVRDGKRLPKETIASPGERDASPCNCTRGQKTAQSMRTK